MTFLISNSDMFLNLRGHLGHNKFSVVSPARLLGERDGRLVFDFSSSLFNLRRALNFVIKFKASDKIRKLNRTLTQRALPPRKLFFIVQDPFLANRLKKFFFPASSASSKHVKIFYNWVSGSLTRADSHLVRNDCTFFFKNKKSKKLRKVVVSPFLVVLLGRFSEMQPIALEAFSLRIPSVAVVDSNFTGREVTFPIFGNDDSTDFLFFVGSLFLSAILFNKKII